MPIKSGPRPGSTWLLLSFSTFPARYTERKPGRLIYGVGEPLLLLSKPVKSNESRTEMSSGITRDKKSFSLPGSLGHSLILFGYLIPLFERPRGLVEEEEAIIGVVET